MRSYCKSMIVGWIDNPKPNQSDRTRSISMVDCCLDVISSSFMPFVVVFLNLPPERVPWGTPAHTENCRFKVYQRLTTPNSGNNLRLIVSTSGVSIGFGVGHRKHTHQWQIGWKFTSFWPYRQGMELGLWGSNTAQTPNPPAKIAPPTHLIVV